MHNLLLHEHSAPEWDVCYNLWSYNSHHSKITVYLSLFLGGTVYASSKTKQNSGVHDLPYYHTEEFHCPEHIPYLPPTHFSFPFSLETINLFTISLVFFSFGICYRMISGGFYLALVICLMFLFVCLLSNSFVFHVWMHVSAQDCLCVGTRVCKDECAHMYMGL